MTDKVIPLRPGLFEKKAEVDAVVLESEEHHPDTMLDAARGELEDVIVVGWHKDTGKLWVGTSPMTYADMLELLELARDQIKHDRAFSD